MKLPERKDIVKPEWADELEQGLNLLWDGVSDNTNQQLWICYTIADNSLKKKLPAVYLDTHSSAAGTETRSAWNAQTQKSKQLEKHGCSI